MSIRAAQTQDEAQAGHHLQGCLREVVRAGAEVLRRHGAAVQGRGDEPGEAALVVRLFFASVGGFSCGDVKKKFPR